MGKTAQKIFRGTGTGLFRCVGMDADDIGREVKNWEKNRWRRVTESKTTQELYIGLKETWRMRVYTAMDMVQSVVSM